MIQGLDVLIVTLLATASMTMLFLFLPALIELKKPKDKGPRVISETDGLRISFSLQIDTVEDEKNYVLLPVSSLFFAIPNMEAGLF